MTDKEQHSKQGLQKVSQGLAEQAESSSRPEQDNAGIESAKNKRAEGELETRHAEQKKKPA